MGAGRQGGWLLRVDSLGDSLWSAAFPFDSGVSGVSGVVFTADENWLVSGGYHSEHDDTVGYFLAKVTDAGRVLWSKVYFDPDLRMGAWDMADAPDDGCLVVGLAYDTLHSPRDWEGHAARFDRDGNCIWSRRYASTGHDAFESVVRSSNGGYVLAGYTHSRSDGLWRGWLVRIDDNGDTVWTRTFQMGDRSGQHFRGAAQAADGGYVAAGHVGNSETAGAEFYLVKVDSSGNLEWENTYGGPGDDVAYAICTTRDQGYLLVGHYDANWHDVWLVKTDAGGTPQWYRTYGGSLWDYPYVVRATPDDGYIVAGVTMRGTEYVYLIKTDADGRASGLAERPDQRESSGSGKVTICKPSSVLSGDRVTLSYRLADNGPVEIALYDVNGRRQAVLASGLRAAGEHRESFTVPERSGVSYLRIATPTGSATAKLVVVGP